LGNGDIVLKILIFIEFQSISIWTGQCSYIKKLLQVLY